MVSGVFREIFNEGVKAQAERYAKKSFRYAFCPWSKSSYEEKMERERRERQYDRFDSK